MIGFNSRSESLENFIYPKLNIRNSMKVPNYWYSICFQAFGRLKSCEEMVYFYPYLKYGQTIRRNMSRCLI